IANASGELRFSHGGDVLDERGGRWSIDGPLEVLDAEVQDGVLRSHAYPDALGRAWSALTCPTSGDVLLSAAPGYEFADWGGVDARIADGRPGPGRRPRAAQEHGPAARGLPAHGAPGRADRRPFAHGDPRAPQRPRGLRQRLREVRLALAGQLLPDARQGDE